jgi:hypothetical protein
MWLSPAVQSTTTNKEKIEPLTNLVGLIAPLLGTVLVVLKWRSERQRLQDAYDEAAAYLEYVRRKRRRRVGVGSKTESRVLMDEVDRAWDALRKASTAVHEHLILHKCAEKS